MFDATCPHCETTYSLAEALRAKRVQCRTCGESFDTPKPNPESPPPSPQNVLACPHCQTSVDVGDLPGGSKSRCPSCSQIFVVPEPKAKPPRVTKVVEPERHSRLVDLFSWKSRFFQVVLVCAAVFAIVAWSQPPGFVAALGSFCVFAVVFLALLVSSFRFEGTRRALFRWSALPVSIALVIPYSKTARYERRWENDGTHFRDTCMRSSDQVIYRHAYGDELDGGTWFAEGPFAGDHRQHGEWSTTRFHRTGFETTKSWYWYGEEITEGEWHLRNR